LLLVLASFYFAPISVAPFCFPSLSLLASRPPFRPRRLLGFRRGELGKFFPVERGFFGGIFGDFGFNFGGFLLGNFVFLEGVC
jgi:hypothetical protein